MRYEDARPRIRSGDLLAWSHRGWRSWYDVKVQLVRVFTRSEYSHVGTAYVMGGRVWVLESVTPLPRLVPLSNLLPCYWASLDAPWRPQTERFALSLIGKPQARYSQLEAVKGFLGQVDPGRDDWWMCAEMTWCLAQSDGIVLGRRLTPSGLVLAAQERGVATHLLLA